MWWIIGTLGVVITLLWVYCILNDNTAIDSMHCNFGEK